jgi:hypothetical protein
MTIKLDYHGGLRYPWLERTGDAETGLDRMLASLTGGPAAAPPK